MKANILNGERKRRMIFENLFKKFKKEEKITEGPYWDCEYVFIDETVDHQDIGGKVGYVFKHVSKEELLEKLTSYNIAAINFAKRRPDLFRDPEDLSVPDDKILKKKAKGKNMKYYYVKVRKEDGVSSYYLGYFVASDECSEPIFRKGVENSEHE